MKYISLCLLIFGHYLQGMEWQPPRPSPLKASSSESNSGNADSYEEKYNEDCPHNASDSEGSEIIEGLPGIDDDDKREKLGSWAQRKMSFSGDEIILGLPGIDDSLHVKREKLTLWAKSQKKSLPVNKKKFAFWAKLHRK